METFIPLKLEKITQLLTVRQLDPVERLEFFTEVFQQSVAIPDIRTIVIFEALQLLDELQFDLAFDIRHLSLRLKIKII